MVESDINLFLTGEIPRSKLFERLRQLETELADARAEIERLKLVSQNQETVIAAQRRSAKAKNALIEQMREALEAIDAIGSEKGDASRDDALRCFSIARAALAAERGE